MWGRGRRLDLGIIRCFLINKKWCECGVDMKMLGDSHQENRGLSVERGRIVKLFVAVFGENG